MDQIKHRVFISYHSANDQSYKDALLAFNDENNIFIDASVDTGDISDELTDEAIREKIRDEYLRNTTVTIVLIGTETRKRKHVDWEIYSSMFDGTKNKKSGILVINLPETGCTYFTAPHGDNEKSIVYPDTTSWTTITSLDVYKDRYPYMPDRILDNLLKPKAKVSVTNWDTLDVGKLRFLIDAAHADRSQCEYDLSRKMRRSNS